MIVLLRHFVGWLIGAFQSREDLILENLALRQQLLTLHAKRPRPRLSSLDGRMQEDKKRLKEEVRRLLAQAEATDAEEDARYGPERRGDELPPELARRWARLQRIREAKRALEERAREQAKSKGGARGEGQARGQNAI